MSRYITGTVTINSRAALVKALEREGFEVQVHDEPVQLYDYVGKARPERAHVLVRKKTFCVSSNDFGFIEEGGVWRAIVSEFDSNTEDDGGWLDNRIGARPGGFSMRIAARALVEHTRSVYEDQGYDVVEEELENGKIKLSIKGFSEGGW